MSDRPASLSQISSPFTRLLAALETLEDDVALAWAAATRGSWNLARLDLYACESTIKAACAELAVLQDTGDPQHWIDAFARHNERHDGAR